MTKESDVKLGRGKKDEEPQTAQPLIILWDRVQPKTFL